MRNYLLQFICQGMMIYLSNSQTIDYQRIGNQIMPLLGKNYAIPTKQISPFKQSSFGILLQEAQWLDVKTRQTADILIYFKDKNQYFSILYANPYLKNQEIEIAYFKHLSSFFITGIEMGNKRQTFINDIPINTIVLALNGLVTINSTHQIFVKFEKEVFPGTLKDKNGLIIGIDNKINESLHLNLCYTYNIERINRGLRGNIKGNFKLFEGEIGWEPLPYSISGGIAFNLPKSCKFGLTLRNHQWLGILTSVYVQKQWNLKTK